MGASALRIAACAGVLVGGLILGGSGAGLAFADPADVGHASHERESSKGVNNERPSLTRIIHRILSEHRKLTSNVPRRAPRAKIGSEPDSGFTASESNLATFAEAGDDPDPELLGDNERGAEPGGAEEGSDGIGGQGTDGGGQTEIGGGSDHVDNTVAAEASEAEKKPTVPVGFPFPYYWLELGGGDWWDADRIISQLGKAISPYSASTRTPEPEPEPVPGPAFRGPAPEAPAPDPVLDASGGVAAGGGGSDYHATGFGGSPVLSAPIVAMPMPPPAAARFPAFPPAAAPGVGAAAARVGTAEPAMTASAVRQAGTAEQAPASALTSMSGQTPRRGYTDYLRSPGLPQLAGAALPGVAGILLMTFGGAVVGYRQASAGRMIRSSAAARYLP
jgi:hypothetical protein